MRLATHDLDQARERMREASAWLLHLGGTYLVTDDEAEVRALRGQAWLEMCDQLGSWDETAYLGADGDDVPDDAPKPDRAPALPAGRLRHAMAAIGISAQGFADYTGANPRNVRRWRLGEQDIPPWVPRMLLLMWRIRRHHPELVDWQQRDARR